MRCIADAQPNHQQTRKALLGMYNLEAPGTSIALSALCLCDPRAWHVVSRAGFRRLVPARAHVPPRFMACNEKSLAARCIRRFSVIVAQNCGRLLFLSFSSVAASLAFYISVLPRFFALARAYKRFPNSRDRERG